MLNSKNSRLFIIGGAADKSYSEFLKLAGGMHAHIVVLGHASSEPRRAAEAVKASLLSHGATNVSVLTPRSTGGIEDDVDGIFMAGGDQTRLVRLLDQQGLSEHIRDAWRGGVLVGGSSAGAAACAPIMIAGGMSDGLLRRHSLELGNGLCVLPNVIVDTHFGQRNRHNRLRAAVATLAGTVGVGLDEDTALVIDGGQARVVGSGSVYLFTRDHTCQAHEWEGIAGACLIQRFVAEQSFSIDSKLSPSVQTAP